MSYNETDMKSLTQQIQKLFKISTELDLAFPGRKFTLDGHLVGNIGEVIAAYHYALKLLPPIAEKHDAVSEDGRLVQIKATQGVRQISLRSEPDYLIVLWINSKSGTVKEIYNGPGVCVWEACGKWASTGTRPIVLSKLRKLMLSVPVEQRIRQIFPFLEENINE